MKLAVETGQAVVITLLDRSMRTIRGQVIKQAGKHVQVHAEMRLPLGSLVKVEWGDYLLMGEVREAEETAGRATVAVEHALSGVCQFEQQRSAWANGAP
jgi:hypothetical protein